MRLDKTISKKMRGLMICIGFLVAFILCDVDVAAATYPHIDYSAQAETYRIYQQRDSDCAVASIASIEAYYNHTTSGIYNTVYSANGNQVYINSWSNLGYEKWSYSLQNLYSALQNGPCIIQRTGHFSVVVAYEGSTTTLEASGFKVMEIVGYYKYDGGYGHPTSWNTSYKNAVKVPLNVWGSYGGASLSGIAVRNAGLIHGSGSGTTDGSRVKNTGVTSIKETTARINASVSPGANVTELGFYLGTSTNNMTKVVESFSGYVESIWYDLGTGKWTSGLNKGTTYYYQIYAIIGGVTYKSAVDSFITAATYHNLHLNPNGGVFNGGSSATVTASPQLIYGGGNWWDISGYAPKRTGYTLNGWYTEPNGGTKVYNADGSVCNEGKYWNNNSYVYNGDLTVYANWTRNTYVLDVNPIIDGTSYAGGMSGYTFTLKVMDGGVDVSATYGCTNQIDYYGSIPYGCTYTLTITGNTDGYTTTGCSGVITANLNCAKPIWQKNVVHLPFTDVPQGSWYYDYVADVYEKGYMVGTGSKFKPGGLLTRAEVVTTLYSVNGKPNASFIGSFSDVKSGQWYSNPISWAYRNGIVSGYANGKFGTSDYITREQFAVMLYQYAVTYNYNTNYNSNALSGYGDAGKVSSWAGNAMKWAVTNGVISGKSGGLLDPKGYTTRAECATMITKLSELAK